MQRYQHGLEQEGPGNTRAPKPSVVAEEVLSHFFFSFESVIGFQPWYYVNLEWVTIVTLILVQLCICPLYSLEGHPGGGIRWLWLRKPETRSDLLLVPQKPYGIFRHFLNFISLQASSSSALSLPICWMVRPVPSMVIWTWSTHQLSFCHNSDFKHIPCAVAGVVGPLS